jgi:hypothetical protein
VHHYHGEKARHVLVQFLVLGAVVSTASGDAITPSYSVTSLGSGAITLSVSNGSMVPVELRSVWVGTFANSLPGAANGGQILAVSNGQLSYQFAFTPANPLTPYQGNTTSPPLAVAAPVNDSLTYGDPRNAYSVVVNALVNAKGTAVAIDSAGVSGHFGTDSAYYVQRNPDGSWGAPSVLWSGGMQFAQGPIVGGVTLAGINSMNQVLGTMNVNSASSTDYAVLYDINSHTLTNLSTLTALASYLNVLPVAIDDLGRILVEAEPVVGGPVQALLLTPAGVSSDPLAVPAPEPGSLAVMAMAMAAFALKAIRRRRR